ncbi:MAG: ABC transporter permease [Chloroflexota bacterium]|nr:ABC transporter permease [Chloroflexota bacterium]
MSRFLEARGARAGLLIVVLAVAAGLAAPSVVPYPPERQDIGILLTGPSGAHLLGVDDLGRDILSRVLFGARVSLAVGVIAVGISLVVGLPVGLLSGYIGGALDNVLMRIMDGLLAFPALVLALAISAVLGPSLENAMVAIGIVGVPTFARLVRGGALGVRNLEYIEAARAIGVPQASILIRHVLPNVVAPVIVQASLAVGAAILTEATLSFLGLGIQPPTPSWGSMIDAGKGYLGTAPWFALAPGVAIFVTVLGFNFLGDALRDTLDPRLR